MNNITEILATLENEETDLSDMVLYFENGYEINFDSNGVAQLWQYETYCGVYDNLYTDLVDTDGIIVDGEIYELEQLEKI